MGRFKLLRKRHPLLEMRHTIRVRWRLAISFIPTFFGARACAIATLLLIHSLLLGVGAWSNFVTIDEGSYIPSGLHHWHTGQFEMYRVNPPLPRLLATASLLSRDLNLNWGTFQDRPGERLEWEGSWAFAKHNRHSFLDLVRISRLMGIAWSILGALVVLRWVDELFGKKAGLVALVLWCFGPNILAYGSLSTPDLPSAVMAIVSCWLFRGYLREPTWRRVWFAGIGFGVALLTKHTFILWLGVWPVMTLVYRFGAFQADRMLLRMGQMVAMLGLGILVLNAGYGFRGSGTVLGDYSFVSKLFTDLPEDSPLQPGNRFSDSIWGDIPVPLPSDYVLGMDLQRVDFESRWPFYFDGVWSDEGRWYFYLIAFAWKVPLACWILFLLSLGMAVCGLRTSWREEFLVGFPAVILLVVISSQTGLNYFRYGLIVLPFALISLSRVGMVLEWRHKFGSLFILGLVVWSIVSSLRTFPNSLMYFNECAGGPSHAHNHLVDSNMDWGQDILRLKSWLDQNHPGERICLGYFGSVDPSIVGISYDLPPLRKKLIKNGNPDSLSFRGMPPGLHAVSIHLIQGGTFAAPNGRDGRQLVPPNGYRHYQQLTPIAKIGTIWVFDLSPEHELVKGD